MAIEFLRSISVCILWSRMIAIITVFRVRDSSGSSRLSDFFSELTGLQRIARSNAQKKIIRLDFNEKSPPDCNRMDIWRELSERG